MRFTPLLLALAACARPHDDDVHTPAAAPEPLPWEGLAATDTVSGEFEAPVGDTWPGTGWFHTEDAARWGAEGSFARIERPDGAIEDVVAVTMVGRTAEGWTTLQLDVAASVWVEGDVELDGDGAVGVIRAHAGGEAAIAAYVVGGVVTVNKAGLADGEKAKGSFVDLTVMEVTP